MTLATVNSRALDGLDAPPVQVEVQLANGLPSFTLVGLADTEVKESRERVRAALQQSGYSFPHNKRITVSLAPADLPKESARFDLPIALGILAASGLLDTQRLADFEFAGELSLAGALRPVRGALALALAVRRQGGKRVLVLPAGSAEQAARVGGGLDIRRAAHLTEVVQSLLHGDAAVPLPAATAPPRGAAAPIPDLMDVKGQVGAKRALEVAAAGGHSLLLVGSPGSGKSMLAQRLAGLLPPMAEDDALQSAAVHSLASSTWDASTFGLRPLRAPHHSASAAALVGGGSPPRPGEISLAHGGVLFLDELPEFPRRALEALREPLENASITIARAARSSRFPARFQLVAAMNPCPCGWLGVATAGGRHCRCTTDAVARYQGRVSGPLLDRIDLQVEVPPLPPAELLAQRDGEPSATVRLRVAAARERMLARQGRINGELDAAGLDAVVSLDAAAARFLQSAAERLGWSARGMHRALKVARSIADLGDSSSVTIAHVAEAMQFRRVLGG